MRDEAAVRAAVEAARRIEAWRERHKAKRSAPPCRSPDDVLTDAVGGFRPATWRRWGALARRVVRRLEG